MPTKAELSTFLEEVEQRAYRRAFMHVKNEHHALDVVQDSMIKLVANYGDRTLAELPMLFQRILSNCIMDWFRAQKLQTRYFSNFSDFLTEEESGESGTADILEVLSGENGEAAESALSQVERKELLELIAEEVEKLPARQREAFLLRYVEDMDVTETSEVMGCSAGSVKQHCFRAVAALSQALKKKGVDQL